MGEQAAGSASGDEREAALVSEVLASFGSTEDLRLREVLKSLVKHLHAFVREVRLSPSEWEAAIEFLTAVGDITTERRQEFVLLSDVLGISMQTVMVNSPPNPAVSESTVLGPFFVAGSRRFENGEDISGGAPGLPCWVEIQLQDESGTAVQGARIEVWGADAEGLYDVQYGDAAVSNRGYLNSDSDGRISFWGILPKAYGIPTDGPVGKLLASAGRSEMRPAHIHFRITSRGYSTLVTHLFAAGDPYLASDAVFGVRPSLVVDFEEHLADETPPGGAQVGERWYSMRHTFVLARSQD